MVFVSSADSSSDSQDQLSSMHLASGLVIPAAVLCWQQPDFGFVLTGQTLVNHLPCTVMFSLCCYLLCRHQTGSRIAHGAEPFIDNVSSDHGLTDEEMYCANAVLVWCTICSNCCCSGAVSEEGCHHRNAHVNC